MRPSRDVDTSQDLLENEITTLVVDVFEIVRPLPDLDLHTGKS